MEATGASRLLPILLLVVVVGAASSINAQIETQDLDVSPERLFNCELHLSKLPSSLLEFSVYQLVENQDDGENDYKSMGDFERVLPRNPPQLLQLNRDDSLDELHYLDLDPHLPFVFFINGFNTAPTINATWMYKTVGVVASYMATMRHRNNKKKVKSDQERANFILLSWHISGLTASDLLNVPIAYYRTMANYETVMEAAERTIMKLIDFVELRRRHRWSSEADRASYYSRFRFYAHSLGSHILSDTIKRINRRRPDIKFGQLVGLDPAMPCFFDVRHGIGRATPGLAVDQVVVLHSNAVFAGLDSKRGDIEVVLNGGTFQPSCNTWDFKCHHLRSTEILTYVDDSCQMVAYRCSDYKQFKLGACEHCNENTDDCFLVNLPEQHVDSDELLSNSRQIRNLGDRFNSTSKRISTLLRSTTTAAAAAATNSQKSFHFVNTNPDFETASHCLQHYQMRLLIIDNNSTEQKKCSFSSFSNRHGGDIEILLFKDSIFNDIAIERTKVDERLPGYKTLNRLIGDKLYTGLITYSGKPVVYDGAIIEGVNLEALSKCLAANNQTDSSFSFVLDVAFMSNIKPAIRYTYSSILCGHWKMGQEELILDLCKQAELANVSVEIDSFLDATEINNHPEPWQVALLNSLFSLYTEWKPL